MESVEAYSMALFTRILDWSEAEAKAFFEDVKKDFRDPKIHAYCNLHFIVGRKPGEDEEDEKN
jgi:hypothetical protein